MDVRAGDEFDAPLCPNRRIALLFADQLMLRLLLQALGSGVPGLGAP
jgi:hypothetical protein